MVEHTIGKVEGLVSVERWSCSRGASCVVEYTIGKLNNWSPPVELIPMWVCSVPCIQLYGFCCCPNLTRQALAKVWAYPSRFLTAILEHYLMHIYF